MKNIWSIFRSDWKRLTASVVAVVFLLGLCLVPCLYAWFNILSNWDPYGPESTGRIKVAVASEDEGCELLGLELNIGGLVLQGLHSNDQMGWVFVEDASTAINGVEAGGYYAALVVPKNFTEDFISILSGDLKHPQIQYYENEKKNAIAPKITGKAKTAVQEQINSTVVGTVAEALTTAGSVFKAMGLDSNALAEGIMEKLTTASQETEQLKNIFLSLQKVMNNVDNLLAAANVTISDAQHTLGDANAAVVSTVMLINNGLEAADETYRNLLLVLNETDNLLSDLEKVLQALDTDKIDEALKAEMHQKIEAAVTKLEQQLEITTDEEKRAQIEQLIGDLQELDSMVDTIGSITIPGKLLEMVGYLRQELLMTAIRANEEVNEYLHTTGQQAQSALRSVQQLMNTVGGCLGEVSGTLKGYTEAMTTVQPTLESGILLADTVSTYLKEIEDDVRKVTESEAFRRFTELMQSSDTESMADYLSSPVQLNTEIIYEIKDYGAAMSPYYVMLALFVGSLLTAVMLKVPVTQPEFAGYNAAERYFGRFVIFFLMAIAQALVTAFGCLYFVRMETAQPALFVLACCLCSLNFACMNYALVYALDNVGMAISVIIMVIQVAGSGGSYPVDVLPQFFQTLYPFMPFHYGMDMIRETVGGMYGTTYLRCVWIMLGMCVIFTTLGLLLYYPARRLNAAIAASKEKSGIM